MSKFDPLHAINLILAGSFSIREPGKEKDYGSQMTGMNNVILRKRETFEASKYLRSFGPSYLTKIPLAELESLILKFVAANYGPLSNYEENFYKGLPFSTVPDSAKLRLAQAFAISSMLNPAAFFAAFPLSTIRVESEFQCETFFFSSPDGLVTAIQPKIEPQKNFNDSHLPSHLISRVQKEKPIAWLGVNSVRNSISVKMKNAILGAVALLPHPGERFDHTMREVVEGHVTFEKGVMYHSGGGSTPPIGTEIPITNDDKRWLQILAEKITAEERESRKQIKALEYFYRAWFLPPADRFSVLFQAIDAIFGDDQKASQAIIDGVEPIVGHIYDEKRIRLLLGLRGSVVHGGSPDVYESSKYLKYYATYEQDPIRDTDKIVAASLKATIFGTAMAERRHFYADLFKEKMGFEMD